LGATPRSPILLWYLRLFEKHYTGTDRVKKGPLGVILLKRAWDQVTKTNRSLRSRTELYQEVLYDRNLFPDLHPSPHERTLNFVCQRTTMMSWSCIYQFWVRFPEVACARMRLMARNLTRNGGNETSKNSNLEKESVWWDLFWAFMCFSCKNVQYHWKLWLHCCFLDVIFIQRMSAMYRCWKLAAIDFPFFACASRRGCW
jgi:hypothetical protein